jgi:hypothetical protein
LRTLSRVNIKSPVANLSAHILLSSFSIACLKLSTGIFHFLLSKLKLRVIYSLGPALIQFHEDPHRRLSSPVSSTHFDEHHRHHLPSTDEQLVRLSTASARAQPHITSLPPPLLGGPLSPTRIHHHHQFGNNVIQGQPPPLLPTPTNNDEHQKQSLFPRRPNRFEEREDSTQSQDNNGNFSGFRGARNNYNDRISSNTISRGSSRGRGG